MTLWLSILGLLAGCVLVFLLFSFKVKPENAADFQRPKYFWASLGLVAVVSLAGYWYLGAQDELLLREKMSSLADISAANPELAEEKARELVLQLESATKRYPDKPDYWYMLASQSFALKDYDSAAAAYAESYRLAPRQTNLLAKQAEAQYLASEYRLTEQVRELFNAVLEKEPNNPIVMSILAITSYRNQQLDMALHFWERGLSALPPNSPDARALQATINQVKARAGLVTEPEAVVPGESFAVNVSLAEGLSFPPETIVFVFVRQAGGPPMPIAVERTNVGALPARFIMSDSKVMIQGQSLTDFPNLEVVARVSLTGQPVPKSGDYQGVYGPISLAEVTEAIDLVVADLVP